MRRPSSSKKALFECASASVRFKYLRGATRIMVSRVTTPSCKAATAITGLIVEHGMKPERKRELLIDDGENAPAGRIDGDYGAIVAAQGVNRGLAHGRVVIRGNVVLHRSRQTWERRSARPSGAEPWREARGRGLGAANPGEAPCNQKAESQMRQFENGWAETSYHYVPFWTAFALPLRVSSLRHLF